MKGVGRNLPMLFLMLVYSGLMCFVGFKSKFLLTSNGVIVSILIAHVFMDLSIMIAHIVLHPMTEKPQKTRKKIPADPLNDNDVRNRRRDNIDNPGDRSNRQRNNHYDDRYTDDDDDRNDW